MKRTTKPHRIGGNQNVNTIVGKIKTVFIAISCPTGDKWQSKTLVLEIFDPRSSIKRAFYACRLWGLKKNKIFFRHMKIINYS